MIPIPLAEQVAWLLVAQTERSGWQNAAFYIFGILLFLTAVFLMMLVLVQRGRGGGLAGALGGAGGQSAFGTKAGDLFTRITMIVAAFWIFLCMAAVLVLNPPAAEAEKEDEPPAMTGTAEPGEEEGGEKEGESEEEGGGTTDESE